MAMLEKVSLAHDQLYDEMRKAITNGWPRVLSSLKSFLEIGHPFDVFA
jgi:hypothetical protein